MSEVDVQIVKHDAGQVIGAPLIIKVDLDASPEEEVLEDIMSNSEVVNISSEVESVTGEDIVAEIASAVVDVAKGDDSEVIVGRHRADGQNDDSAYWRVFID
ncbi:hypothetical protein [Stenotrophomonas sp. YAU14A_MKIMI4_1]|uniref:hypothetical protein n=1 Tax=Stenotrophomonas sp. YAU14A_MKIMI4_1 TaxID=2072408 RepID=UPI000D540A48|nr:hypothetical protein [Stenotrophomonas sp. YAU14A_MKIMI4_1]AWH29565.1 hypothetical protein C1931_11935 [Stenotrophomonas sp. YAU14A_MKIMI4_1]